MTKRGSNTEVLLALEEAAIERARKAGKLISCLRSITTSAQFNNKFTKLTLKTISGKVVHAEDHEFTMRCHDAGVELHILKNPKIMFF